MPCVTFPQTQPQPLPLPYLFYNRLCQRKGSKKQSFSGVGEERFNVDAALMQAIAKDRKR
ncbi:hypothetical protein [Nostoc sp. FACHB-888]|uniref:hypothetical protein n=1 Tax=Nostoc sp. FACHB-888 TaxID=2692842 RepID=UPI0016871389|nr:hypothetical protein [Nostoc sp. FACHB-888]MBD2242134.1 hypothetical protein [Nostoc sp. FACHB-888]